MLKPLLDLIKQVFAVTDQLQRHQAEIKELREQHQAMMTLVHKLEARIERVESDGKHEREKIVLQLQNALLQFERRLPPAS